MADMVETLAPTSRYVGQDCTRVLQDLTRSMRKIIDREEKRSRQAAKTVERDFEARKSGGLWEDITTGPLQEYRRAISGAITDYQDTSLAEQSFLDKYQKYLDLGQTTAGLGVNLASGIVSSVVDEMGVINEVSEAAGMGSLVPTGEASSCEDEVLAGTVSGVFKVGVSAGAQAAQAVFAVQSSVGLALQAVPEIYAALMSMPSGLLSSILTNKEALLDKIESTVQAVVSIVVDMTEDDYPFDHRAFILAAIAALEEADGDLATVESVLEAGGAFQETNWNRARSTIKDTGEDLLDVGPGSLRPGFTHLKILKLIGYQKVLETQIRVLDERQALFAQITSQMAGFRANFQANAQFQNLMGPIVQQVRCTLQQIISDMNQTVDINALLRYYLKEKQWGMELVGLATLMSNTGHLGDEFSAPSANLNAAADALSDGLSQGEAYFSGAESYDRLISHLQNFISEIKRKVNQNVSSSALEGIAAAIYSEIERQRNSDSDLADLLNGFNESIASEGAAAVQAVTGLLGMLDMQGLDTIVDAIMEGDVSSFFGTQAVTRQVESAARKALGEVLQCCTDNAGDGSVSQRLVRMNRTVQALERAKAVYDDYTTGYADRYVDAVYKNEIPGLRQINQDLSHIQRASCINQGEQGQLGSLGLTLF